MPRPESEHEREHCRHPRARAGVELREQHHGDRHDRRACDREVPVAPEPRDRLPAHDRRHEHARHQRGQLQAGARRARSLRHLQVERQVGDRAEEREADDEADGARDGEGVVAEERQRQDRLGGAGLLPDERRQEDHARDDQADHLRRAPPPRRPAEAREEDDRAEAGCEERRAEVVHRVPARDLVRVERDRDHRRARSRPRAG